ncbi:putative DNA glycosylase At3g47830 isoform X2 [Zingiber officinale]|uniref:putative DNA glycosylase At3g47830 isoform X2 n=1 Tax=Zingiber officinale TaxID=94328 RepID=UPI001C4BB344|nr:putative DNA glycosylase At3g47830 isoform X2 [Zingiber officinale]
MAGDFRVLPLLILALSSRGFLEMSTNPIAHGEDFRCGGLAVTKAASIKNILRALKEKRGEICLEYLRSLSVDEIKAELSKFKGIGPKTGEELKIYYAMCFH